MMKKFLVRCVASVCGIQPLWASCITCMETPREFSRFVDANSQTTAIMKTAVSQQNSPSAPNIDTISMSFVNSIDPLAQIKILQSGRIAIRDRLVVRRGYKALFDSMTAQYSFNLTLSLPDKDREKLNRIDFVFFSVSFLPGVTYQDIFSWQNETYQRVQLFMLDRFTSEVSADKMKAGLEEISRRYSGKIEMTVKPGILEGVTQLYECSLEKLECPGAEKDFVNSMKGIVDAAAADASKSITKINYNMNLLRQVLARAQGQEVSPEYMRREREIGARIAVSFGLNATVGVADGLSVAKVIGQYQRDKGLTIESKLPDFSQESDNFRFEEMKRKIEASKKSLVDAQITNDRQESFFTAGMELAQLQQQETIDVTRSDVTLITQKITQVSKKITSLSDDIGSLDKQGSIYQYVSQSCSLQCSNKGGQCY